MATYGNDDGKNIRPGHARLAEDFGVTTRAVKVQVAKLVENGWLPKVGNGSLGGTRQDANVYELAIPDPAEDARHPERPVRHKAGSLVASQDQEELNARTTGS